MIYLDLETTGFDGEKNDIIEIYLLKENASEEIIAELHYYLKTDLIIDPAITKINGLDNAFLKDKKYFREVIQNILNFIGNETLVGHNIDSFDLPFLNANLIKKGFSSLTNPTIDTLVWARKIDNASKFAKGYKLVDLCLKYQIFFDSKKMHTAKYDVLLTRSLYKILKKLI